MMKKKLKKFNGIALWLCFLLLCAPYAGSALSIEEMPVDMYTLEELEEILQAKGYNVEREAPKETDDTSGIRILINGVKLEIPQGEPGAFINDDNRTLIPVRFVTEGLGADIQWDEVTRAVDIRLDDMHLQKIDMAEAIYVINPGGYIGSSTRKEIEYAEAQGKQVLYHH